MDARTGPEPTSGSRDRRLRPTTCGGFDRLADWVRAASNYHVVSATNMGRTNGSVLSIGSAIGGGFKGGVARGAIIERCCGLDVHKDTVVACVLIGPADGRARKEIRTYGTTPTQLEQMRDWLSQVGCTHIGMESTSTDAARVCGARGAFRTHCRQRGAHEERAWQEDGSEGLAMDCGLDPSWAGAKELRTAEVATSTTRSDAVSTKAG
jgi:hypothetical protein